MALASARFRQEMLVIGAGWGILLLAACVDRQPTAVVVPGGPSKVVRGYENGCEPEVIEEYTDSTETLLITFTPAKADKYPCVLNLAKYGIDMGDPTRVDTPQGDGTWKARTYHDTWWDLPDLNMSNLPSPDFVASANHYTPPQGFIEFDPAVRSAEFFYSRLLQERAIWRGVYGHYDSMLVQALDRAPGTVSYNLYDRKVLRSNVQSTSPPWNNWTHAKLASREGDKIQWLWFDGHLLIDNLKITRAPLTCGSFGSLPYAVRGYEVTCRVSGGKWSVTGWEFKPDGAGLPVVQDPSTDKQWKGIAATGGTVTVHVTDGTTPRAFKAHFYVADRNSPWKEKWSYRWGPELTAKDIEPLISSWDNPEFMFGLNCVDRIVDGKNQQACGTHTGWVQPHYFVERGAGYTGKEIPSGPNKGYWYVAEARYVMWRVGNANPAILSGSNYRRPVPADIAKKCRLTSANFYEYNEKCRGITMTSFVKGVEGHEGRGINGGTGHMGLAETEARKPENDPYAAIERLIHPDSATLDGAVVARLRPIQERIFAASADEPPPPKCQTQPTGNWTGRKLWYWDDKNSPNQWVEKFTCGS